MMSTAALEFDYLDLADCTPERCRGALGAAVLGTGTAAPPVGFPLARVHAPLLGRAGAALELWRAGQVSHQGRHGAVHYSAGEALMFGSLSLDERLAGGTGEAPPPLQAATSRAYRELFATLALTGHPHLIRVWNYIPDINLETHGLERYRQFNSARQEALLACGRASPLAAPAASALGSSHGSPLVVYFLASRQAPTLIENPRQMSAYHYPQEYGPSSPVFSRAAVLGAGDAATLFISGTASIVGHRTVHAGDPVAQTRESLANIEAVIEQAARGGLARKPPLERLAYKVYVRDPADLPRVRTELHAALGTGAAVLYLQADVCRRDLAVEIEAVWAAAPRAAG